MSKNPMKQLPLPAAKISTTRSTLPMAMAKPVTPPLPQQASWADKMGSSVMRGEMRQGQQQAQKSQDLIQQVAKETSQNKPFTPPASKPPRITPQGSGKPPAPIKAPVNRTAKTPKPDKATAPGPLVPPENPAS